MLSARGFVVRLLLVATLLAAFLRPVVAQDGSDFPQWVQAFRTEATSQGIAAATLDRAFAGVKFNARIIELDRFQPEFVKPIQDYIGANVTAEAIARGREKLQQHAALLDRVGRHYGVPAEYIVAIWRIETGYGANFGNFNVVEALATLAYAGRRQPYWRSELVAALRLLESGEVPAQRLVGSWAGAMGHTQFMPSVYLGRAVDFDGDGKRDLWNSLPDVFASTANYLAKAGWQNGVPFGIEVKLPASFPYELTETAARPIADWTQLGVTQIGGEALPAWPGTASIIVPAGHRGPAFLVTANYQALLAYNNAASYALSVALLAERFRGRGLIATPWPANDRLLSRAEKEELQRLLAERGFDPGPVDGQVGPSTRAAIRQFQKKAGVPADGFANFALLELVRRAPR
jgi:lytic murein transglycosylase